MTHNRMRNDRRSESRLDRLVEPVLYRRIIRGQTVRLTIDNFDCIRLLSTTVLQ